MSVDAYSTVRMGRNCTKNRIKLRKHNLELKNFPPASPLEHIAVDILGELPRTPRGHRYLSLMLECYSKLIPTVSLQNITAETVRQAFISHWLLVYGSPVKLISDNGNQFTSNIFVTVGKMLSIESAFTTAYPPDQSAGGEIQPNVGLNPPVLPGRQSA